uniref:Uncharacterized protein n=1 Tax=Aegilops tauschii subsp. strangulata TaxID=200361 RepID=A0A452XXK1_AEGTS
TRQNSPRSHFVFKRSSSPKIKDQLIKASLLLAYCICNLISQLLHVEGMVKIPDWLGVRKIKRADSKMRCTSLTLLLASQVFSGG